MTKAEIIEDALIGHWNNDSVSLEDTCRVVYKKTLDEVCKYLKNNMDEDLIIYKDNTWCDVPTFIKKLRKELMK